MTTDGSYSLPTNGMDVNSVLSGSFISMKCNTGYTYGSGQLNITCVGTAWTTFPTCVSTSGATCVVDMTSTFNITNGYYTSQSLSFTSSTTATGSIQFACSQGYVLDPTIGASYTCNNGVWSTKPRCLMTGRCSYSALQTYISSATGLRTTTQQNLMAASADAVVVFNDSYIVLACANGYVNTGGSLNVTCLNNGSWTQFPSCILSTGSGSLTTTTIATSNGLPCTVDPNTSFNITNGYYTLSSLGYTSTTTATGWIQFTCMPGYILDPNIGALYNCNNGVWSTKPQCLITGRCSYTTLQNFIFSATGIQTTGQNRLMASSTDATIVFNDSYAVLACTTGYVNIGGSLNVTCLNNGSWTQFPNCVINSGSITTTTTSIPNQLSTTTIAPSTGAACSIDSTTFTVTNGYYASSTLSYTSATTVTGTIIFACASGYVLDPTVGASYTCNNGVWSTKPRCSITGRCSIATLQNFISTAAGLQIVDQKNLLASSQDTTVVFQNSFVIFSCASGYVNAGGNLNVTCLSTGSWTQFPSCVLNSGGGSLTTTTTAIPNQLSTTTVAPSTGAACNIDASTFTITNGYYANSALTYTSSTTATGSIQFACNVGYVLDTTVGAIYTCNNGVWSTKPRCSMTARCTFSTLQNFISTASGLQIVDQKNLLASAQDTTSVFVNSFIVFACASGYVNTGGSLNVTCLSTGSWSQFPSCVLNTGGITTTTVSGITTTTVTSSGGVPCTFDASTFTISNGYYVSSTLSYTSATTATGSIQFACNTGYALDTTVGATYTCNNGVWSTKPRCNITARCPFSTLQSFISTASGIQIVDQKNLLASAQDTSIVFVNSFIVFACASGYVNTGGSLNVTCLSTGSWSQFPSCVLNTGGITTTTTSAMVTTTVSTNTGTACAFDASTFTVTNGYYVSSSLTYTSATTATGSIQFACNTGYTLDSTVGAVYTCNNGVWSTKPRCNSTARCPFSNLQSFISTASGIQIVDQKNLLASAQDTTSVFVNSFIVFACASGYINAGGSLNVTCLSTGSWSQFPSCVLNTGGITTTTTSAMVTTTVSTNTGAACTFDASTFTVTNGYYVSSTLTYTSATTATGSIQFACNTGYALDTTVGATYNCNNGVWSTKPRCNITARCPFSTLQSFISTANGIQIVDQKNLVASAQDTTTVFVNSFIVFACASGYINVGGSLNVSCLSSGSWSQFPSCVFNNGAITTTTTLTTMTTTVGSNGGVGCTIDTTTFSITNGYYTSSSITYTTASTVTGSIQFACMPGYALDSTIGGTYTCMNGVWSTKPRCSVTGRCSFSTLQNFISTATGIQFTDQKNLLASAQDSSVMFANSFIVFTCASGYVNTGGSLNVTCLNTGLWSQFPNCVLNTSGITTTTTSAAITTTLSSSTGLGCTIDASTFTIANGYYSSSALTYTSATTAAGSIQFACIPGYALDATVGATYTCNSGIWSTKPRCSATGRCYLSTLQSFISTATGIQIVDQKNLLASTQDTSAVLANSFIVLACANGYTNTGGSLNVSCSSTGSWSQFPNCVVSSGSGVTTTTVTSNTGVGCPIDTSTFTINNGYYTSSSLKYTSATAATGSIQFSCMPGYNLDSMTGGTYTCTNGVWSTKPTCSITSRCTLTALQNFISTATGIQIVDQKNLMASSQETNAIFVNSYIVFACANGYINTGGSLNVTCLSNGSWTQFPNCVFSGGSGVTTTTVAGNTSVGCSIDATATFTVTNGYYVNSSLAYTSSSTATGWVRFTCIAGYTVDQTIGPLYTCTNGVWSTKPRCLTTGRCSYSALKTFISTATGIQVTSQNRLTTAPEDSNSVLSDSFIVLTCTSGFTNTGGSLNVTCLSTNSWTQFPNCVLGSGSGSITTTTLASNSGLACLIDASSFTVTNGYYTSTSLSYTSATTATGSIQFACVPGYTLDSTVGAVYTCNNGVWSTKPRCNMTARCSFTTLQNFLTSATGIQTTDQRNLVASTQDSSVVFVNSYIVLTCTNGYVNTGGSLNVTCLGTGSWSQFPSCVLNGGSGVITTTTTTTTTASTGLSCVVDASIFTITNGYYSSSALTYTSSTTATGWIQFTCSPGYVLDSTVGASYTCNNGIWSTKPRCLITGRCTYSALQSFISTATGVQTTNQSRLVAATQDTTAVLNGSYILLACVSGYTNIGGSLNITCLNNGSWSQFPNCVLNGGGGGVITTTTQATGNGVACTVDATTYTISNGYYVSSTLSYVSSTAATGSIQFACSSGYVLDSSIGATYTCTSGVWSKKPQCLMTGRCSYTLLKNFLSTASGLQATSQNRIVLSSQDSNAVLNDSYIVFTCASGYINVGGSLNVTCLSTGSWSQFPSCVLNNGAITTTTTLASSTGAACAIDASTFTITNGYYSSSALSYTSATTATGWIQFTCASGYSLDSGVGARYTCNNGIWSTKPRCIVNSQCSYSTLNNFVLSANTLKTTYDFRLTTVSQDTNAIVSGSYVVLACLDGYINTGGNLNVTCLSNGSWSQFPSCVRSTQSITTTVATGTGMYCSYDASRLIIANGYANSYSGIMSPTANLAVSGAYINYVCVSPYVLVGNSQITCTNGVWSTSPVCTSNASCSLSQLSSALVNVQVVSKSLFSATNGITVGSWIQVQCSSGFQYNSLSGPLNITCLATGSWTQFPICS
ncbi:unnamed protein product [Adineta ricciae]|uniref:Sushi domain-containing protein n=1 Tax=Adineta ricciae TaxID=249248 RepID=A0A813P3X7_ADIRI|nr:unnamed protein product [Adineta ricciae]